MKALFSSELALAVLCRYINQPAALFDECKAVEPLQSFLYLARNKNRQKVDEYAATLDEIKTRSDFVNDQFQHLFLVL